jgi:hypothetical protein
MRTQLASARTELETTRGQQERTWAELQTTRTELQTTRTELETTRTELETLKVSASDGPEETPDGLAPGLVADLKARIAELETLRREDVSQLQRTQQALANTQYEMTGAARRAKEAEERLRELEGESPVPRPLRGAASKPGDADADPGEALVSAIETMTPPGWVADTSAGEVEGTGEMDVPAAPADEADEDVPENHVMPSKEGMSLRERLTRAAAARHRISAPAEEEQAER